MMCLIILTLLWGLISCLYSLISANPWLWFAWVPLGLITTLMLFAGWLYLICLPVISKINPNNRIKIFYTVHVLKMVNFLFGVRIKVEGLENLTKEHKVLYVANHKSNLDPFFMFEAMNVKGPAAACKSDLWNIAPFVPFLNAFHMLKINRSSDRDAAKSIVEGIKFMKEGNGIILFPEGGIKTREVEQMVSIKPGAYKLATKSDAIIQPMAILGASKVDSRKFFDPFVKVTVRFLPYITPEDYKDLNTHELAYKVLHMVNDNFPNEEKIQIEEEN
jgi:1-acyl-sn-glycerol-3-phosphate acyltransferase